MYKILIILLTTISLHVYAGEVKEKINSFNTVEVFGKLNVRLEKAIFDSIYIQSSQFDVNDVKYEVSNNELTVKLLSEFPPSIKVNVTIFYKDSLVDLKGSGGAKIYNKGSIESSQLAIKSGSGSEYDLLVNVDSLNVKVSKGAFVRLTGESRMLVLKTNTGGAFRSTNLNNDKTYAVLNGGTAEIKTANYLNVKTLLGASLKYVEKPQKIVRKERLGGEVSKLEEF